MLVNVIIDAHVHLYPRYNLKTWLNHAFTRIEQIDAACQYGVLFITESDNEGAWDRLVISPEHHFPIEVLNKNSAWLSYDLNGNERRILFIRGRQFKTKENIEVIAINGDLEIIENSIPQSQALSELVATVFSHNGLAILPWGFGKWMGSRGRVVRDFVASGDRGLIGDNGGRPQWLDGEVFNLWLDVERIDLAGSDPLDIKGHEQKILRCVIEANLSPSIFQSDDPAGVLLSELERMSARSTHQRLLAERPSAIEFLVDQAKLKLRKFL